MEKCFINSRKSICHNITWNAASLSFHKSGFPGFLYSLLMPFWPSSNKGNTHTVPPWGWCGQRAFTEGPLFFSGEWFFHRPHFCGFGLLTVPIVISFLLCLSNFYAKLTFGLLPHCPPSFIANNYPWYFGSGGLLCPSHLEQRVISSWNPLGKMPKYFLIRRGKNDNSLNPITPMYWVGQKIQF